ncbi:LysR family transcriptional regulator [Sodalis praecaptivus]|uniref:LysR family transcriptional regulator n=1 Tax=Sodalis praecaptivus TaxID=1239307 RepID=UPI0027E61A92|nr:LysR family transcriptional regulator [Sodalis praecaptivus]CAJ0993028.1 hypothetical protein NVIRENTERO_00819 [Sodalis praecaptivus]
MRLRHIEIIHAIMASGSISGAARRLNVSQPNISRVLAHAEQQLGFALFDRRPSGLQPTSRAQRMMPEIDQLYLQLQRIDQLAQRLRAPEQLCIGTAHAIGQSLMAQVLLDYRRQAEPLPADVELVTGHHDTLCQDLLADRLDLALTFGQSLAPRLTAEVLCRADMVALVPPSVTVAAPVSLAWLCEHHLLMMQPQDPLGRVLHQTLRAQGLRSCGTLQIKTYSVIADMVLAGGGVGIVDTFTARRYAQQLQVVKIQGALPFEVQLLMTASHAADPAVLLMRSIIRRRLEQWVDAQAA